MANASTPPGARSPAGAGRAPGARRREGRRARADRERGRGHLSESYARPAGPRRSATAQPIPSAEAQVGVARGRAADADDQSVRAARLATGVQPCRPPCRQPDRRYMDAIPAGSPTSQASAGRAARAASSPASPRNWATGVQVTTARAAPSRGFTDCCPVARSTAEGAWRAQPRRGLPDRCGDRPVARLRLATSIERSPPSPQAGR